MPWIANNNQPGKIRAPSQLNHVSQVPSSSKKKLRMVHIKKYSNLGLDVNSNCCYLNSQSLPADAINTKEQNYFIYPRTHAQFVVLAVIDHRIPIGQIVLTEVQFVNLELCEGATETWSLFSDAVPDALNLVCSIRPMNPLSHSLSLNENEAARCIQNYCWNRIITVDERVVLKIASELFFVRIQEVDGDDLEEDEYSLPDIYRVFIIDNTRVYVNNDCCVDPLFHFSPSGSQVKRDRIHDVVTVITNDEEEFPVKKKLLYACISLTSAVMAGKGVHKEASSKITVDVDCCTFDRVLLYLVHECKGIGKEFGFDPTHTEVLLEAGKKLGIAGLVELCQQRLGEFETRVRTDPISWDEVVEMNSNGKIILVMQGMIFDVTRWLPEHPGGSVIIPREALNIDCTVMFEIYHASRQSFRYLKQFYIGELHKNDYSKVPESSSTPSFGFLAEFKQYTKWRIVPEEKVYKSF